MENYELTEEIIRCAITVHKALGPGLLESSYKNCLAFELAEAGFKVEREKDVPLIYKDIKLECGYRIDLLIEDKIVLEIKSVEALHDIHLAQGLTYLKLGNYLNGLLLNFNVTFLKYGIKRLLNPDFRN